MAYELEVPVRHRTLWLAFADPERMARAVPGLTVDAVQAVPPEAGPAGVSGDVVAGRLKLRVGGAGASGSTITYRGTARIAAAEAEAGTLELAVDVAQARGDGALGGVLRIALRPSGAEAEKTTVSVETYLELSGRALNLKDAELGAAARSLADRWLSALAALYQGDEPVAVEPVLEEVIEAEPIAEETVEFAETVEPAESAEAAEPAEAAEAAESAIVEPEEAVESAAEVEQNTAKPVAPVAAVSDPLMDDSLSADPLDAVWRGETEKSLWAPVIGALTLLLLVRRRRRRRRAADAD